MTSLLVQFMWMDAVAYWLDMLIAFLVGALLSPWIVKAWKAVVRWAWGEPDRNGYKR